MRQAFGILTDFGKLFKHKKLNKSKMVESKYAVERRRERMEEKETKETSEEETKEDKEAEEVVDAADKAATGDKPEAETSEETSEDKPAE